MFPKILMPKIEIKILSVDNKTAGGRHYWCTAECEGKTFSIRKPIGAIKSLLKN